MRSEADIPSTLSDYIGGSLKDVEMATDRIRRKAVSTENIWRLDSWVLYIPAGTAVPHHSHNGNELTLVLKELLKTKFLGLVR